MGATVRRYVGVRLPRRASPDLDLRVSPATARDGMLADVSSASVAQPDQGRPLASAGRLGAVVALRTEDGRPVCERCSIAATVRTRTRGLLGRDDLPAGSGIWIKPTNSIHMFFMRFAIDAVFLDRDDAVVRIVPGLRPWRMASCRRARSVVELRAGDCERRGVEVGDRLLAGPTEEHETDD